ncbi:WD40/YVTN/BNR-like repeat-containing protein [Rubrobacter xylanophilus]|uniref:WD40/YVTN/BNR-like repeat-containing protein n=1 Tax=Rubrobacter xylanophilus TaxID=49319 RepID=UPI001C63D560|nr:hypothetical protein [Rubrobacter xylanophilus]
MTVLYAAGAGAFAAIRGGRVELSLEGMGAGCLAVAPEDPWLVYAGTHDEGVFRSSDGGRGWERAAALPHRRVTALAISPRDRTLYAGTEPSSLFVSRDGGESWRELEGLRRLPSAPTWSFPPRPWTSHVRAIAPSPADAGLVLVGIELGGVVRSPDGGVSWQDQRPGAVADCHALAVHPADSGLVYEAGGGGFAESRDFGGNWEVRNEGLRHRYVWGLAVDPVDPGRAYVSAASGPGRAHGRGDSGAAIYVRRDGRRWEALRENLSAFPYALATAPDEPGVLYAGFGDGRVCRLGGGGLREVATVPGGVAALVALPERF